MLIRGKLLWYDSWPTQSPRKHIVHACEDIHAYSHACAHVYTEIVLDSLKLIQCTLLTKNQKDERGEGEYLSMSVFLWEMTSNLEI